MCDGKRKCGLQTPDLRGTFLIGKDDEEFSERKASPVTGQLEKTTKGDDHGFCFQKNTKEKGCKGGERYMNHVALKTDTLASYLTTQPVQYIMKC